MFDWSKMAAEGFPGARIDGFAKPCEPAIHVLRSVAQSSQVKCVTMSHEVGHKMTKLHASQG